MPYYADDDEDTEDEYSEDESEDPTFNEEEFSFYGHDTLKLMIYSDLYWRNMIITDFIFTYR